MERHENDKTGICETEPQRDRHDSRIGRKLQISDLCGEGTARKNVINNVQVTFKRFFEKRTSFTHGALQFLAAWKKFDSGGFDFVTYIREDSGSERWSDK